MIITNVGKTQTEARRQLTIQPVKHKVYNNHFECWHWVNSPANAQTRTELTRAPCWRCCHSAVRTVRAIYSD